MITQERLKQILSYCPHTGAFKWRVNQGPQAPIGSKAGTVNGAGYCGIRADGKIYQAHRLAFLYMIGDFPEIFTDHIDQDKLNNRWLNLRSVTSKENQKNLPMPKTNTSGFTGVNWHKGAGKWRAEIQVDGQAKHLGVFSDINDAIEARKKANIEYGFHANHGRSNKNQAR